MFRIAAFVTLLLATNASAFSVGSPALLSRSVAQSNTARNVLLSQEETDYIIGKAEDCVDDGCSVDDVSLLLGELKDQQEILNNRLVDVMNMVAHLQKINTHGKDRNEVKAFVEDLLRVFNHSDPKIIAGFSGDIGKGPTTAYDALDPVAWKPSKGASP